MKFLKYKITAFLNKNEACQYYCGNCHFLEKIKKSLRKIQKKSDIIKKMKKLGNKKWRKKRKKN